MFKSKRKSGGKISKYKTSMLISNTILAWLREKDPNWKQDEKNPYILKNNLMCMVHIHPDRNEIKYWDDYVRCPHLIKKITLPKYKEQMFHKLWPYSHPKQLEMMPITWKH